MPRSRLLVAVLTSLAIGPVVGCGGRGGPSTPVVVDGSSTVYPVSVAAQEAYSESVEGTPRITVNMTGTGGGFGRYIEGEVDIVDASRPAKPEEEAQAKARGYDWTRFTVGHDGITVAVNPANDFVDSLTVDQLRDLFEPGSAVKSWKDLNPEWPDEAIVLYTPDDDSGTYDFFLEALELEQQRQEGVQPSSDDNVLVNGIAGDDGALGYFGFAYYVENQDKLKAVPIKAGDDDEPVAPTPETIFDGSYTPFSRPLFIYVKDSSMERPEVADFVTYYVDHAGELAEQVGYVGPDAKEEAANRSALAALKGGEAPAEAGEPEQAAEAE